MGEKANENLRVILIVAGLLLSKTNSSEDERGNDAEIFHCIIQCLMDRVECVDFSWNFLNFLDSLDEVM